MFEIQSGSVQLESGGNVTSNDTGCVGDCRTVKSIELLSHLQWSDPKLLQNFHYSGIGH